MNNPLRIRDRPFVRCASAVESYGQPAPIFAGLGTALNATHFFEPEIFAELLLP